jgi:hypothetical protein
MPSAKKEEVQQTNHLTSLRRRGLVRKITTYPVLLSGPLQGKQRCCSPRMLDLRTPHAHP